MLLISRKRIDNFILLRYRRADLRVPGFIDSDEDTTRFYLESQEALFEMMVGQIRHFHPGATIHVLTNDPGFRRDDLVVHTSEFHSDHRSKFLLFGLLDEPALYLDCDLVLLRPFDLDCTSLPVNVFAATRQYDLQRLSPRPLPAKVTTIYNAGVLWIGSPGNATSEELQRLHEDYFSDHGFITSRGMWPNNDEYSLSLYISKNNVPVRPNRSINVHRLLIRDIGDVGRIQSIHYTGLKLKRAMFDEFERLHTGPVSAQLPQGRNRQLLPPLGPDAPHDGRPDTPILPLG